MERNQTLEMRKFYYYYKIVLKIQSVWLLAVFALAYISNIVAFVAANLISSLLPVGFTFLFSFAAIDFIGKEICVTRSWAR